MPNDAYQLIRKCQTLTTGLPKASMQGVTKAAEIMTAAVVTSAGKYAGHKIVRTKTVLVATPEPGAIVKMVSRKAHLLDHDTKAHDIKPRRAPILVFPNRKGGGGMVFRMKTHQLGTKGKFIWEKAVVVARPQMVAAINESIGAHLIKTFQ